MLRGQFLPLITIKIFNISTRGLLIAMVLNETIYPGHWIFGGDTDRRQDHLKLVLGESLLDQGGLAFKGEQDITHAVAGKGGHRAVSAGVENGHVRVELRDKITGLLLSTGGFLQRISPRRQIAVT